MAYVYNDIDGIQHDLYDSIEIEEIIEIVTGNIIGYRTTGLYGTYKITKETYEAIKKIVKS